MGLGQGFVFSKLAVRFTYIHIYIYMYMHPPWTLVLLPFGNVKSNISRFRFSKFPNCGSPKPYNLDFGVPRNVPV